MPAEPRRVLPRGRHAAPREVVAESQRVRLLDAMAGCVAAQGWAATSVADVLKAAGVSRKTFYEHFTNKEDCFLQAFDLGAARLMAAIDDAVAAEDDPIAGAAAGVHAYLRAFAERPEFARTYVLETDAAGRAAVERRAAVHERFAAQLRAQVERARAALPELPVVPEHRYLAIVGAVDALVNDHLRRHDAIDVDALAGPVLDVVLTLVGAQAL